MTAQRRKCGKPTSRAAAPAMTLRRVRRYAMIGVVCFTTMTTMYLSVLSSVQSQEFADFGSPREARRQVDGLPWMREPGGQRTRQRRSSSWLLAAVAQVAELLFPPSHQLEVENRTHYHGQPQPPPPPRNCRKLRFWPSGLDEQEDRIPDQLRYTVPQSPNISNDSYHKGTDIPRHLRVILSNRSPVSGQQRFLADQCPVNNCYVTKSDAHGPIADAVLFYTRVGSVGFKRPPHQRWILYLLESPAHATLSSGKNQIVNFTATYRLDSTIVTPYERFVPYDNASLYQAVPPKRNYAAGKNRSVAWFVSNCNARNNRLGYAKELAKYIDVDIYGPCGNMNCPRKQAKKCFGMLNKQYKFYLAFENSNCKDYITEKFYWNALWNDIVPIVMGARPEDYRKVAPLNSYIHVDDFASPKELAAYLHKVSKDDQLYNKYFRWKGSGFFINTKFWCRLCALVNDDTRLGWYEDVGQWWGGPGVCIHPSADNPFTSWRLAKTQSYHNMSRNNPLLNPHYVHVADNASSSYAAAAAAALSNHNVICE